MSTTSASVTPEDDATKREHPRDAKPFLEMIEDAETIFKPWNDACDNIDKLYASLERLRSNTRDRQFQMFHANLETLKTAIYARPPQPVVVPRHKQRQQLPRKASELLERCLTTNADLKRTHKQYKLVRDDLALHGRGVPWVSYEVKRGRLEYACTQHISRKDFLHEPARKWDEVGWVAKRAWLTLDMGVKRFGAEFRKASFDTKETDTPDDYKIDRKAPVWEMWNETEGKVIWITPGVENVLDERPAADVLDLEGFFPCPEPAYATREPGSLIPVPDMLFYKDQLEEINELTARISALCDGLRLKGFYPAGAEGVSDAIETAIKSRDNRQTLVPIPSAAAMSGIAPKDIILWLPIEQVAIVLKELLFQRKQLIDDVYEISGISDIMRGATEASETATAQQLKSQYGNVRVRGRQDEMVRVSRDCILLEGEIMAEEFQPDTLNQMSQMDLPREADVQQQLQMLEQQVNKLLERPEVQKALQDPEQQQQVEQVSVQLERRETELRETVTFEAVIKYIKDERLRPYVLDIETDSTIQPDEDAEKQRRTEFVQTLGAMLQQSMEMVAAAPESAGFVGEVIKFGTAPFRVGRSLEGEIDDFVEQMKQRAGQPQPDPAAAAAEVEKAERAEQLQADIRLKQQDAAAKVKEMEAKAGIDAQAADQASQLKQKEAFAEAERVRAQTDQRAAEHAQKLEHEAQLHAQAMERGRLELDKINVQIAGAQAASAAKAAASTANGSGESHA